jgi:hypothetical protein
MAEHRPTDKSRRAFARPLRDLAGKVVGDTFRRQGFASAELVTRWTEIVGAQIAAHCEPVKIQWSHRPSAVKSFGRSFGANAGDGQEPGTLVLRVEGPAAIEIQHLAPVICERVNRFLGWRGVARLAFRQAPLRRGVQARKRRGSDPAVVARAAASLPEIADEDLRQALARLRAAIKGACTRTS